jgi:hypothetical protein
MNLSISEFSSYLTGPSQNAEYEVYLEEGRGNPLWAPGPSTGNALIKLSLPDHSNIPFNECLPSDYEMDEGGTLNDQIPLGESKVEERSVRSCSSSFYRRRSVLILDVTLQVIDLVQQGSRKSASRSA